MYVIILKLYRMSSFRYEALWQFTIPIGRQS